MEVEVVRFDKNNIDSMKTIVIKKFYNTNDANKFYTNWMCDEYDNSNVLILGEDWNDKEKTEEEVPEGYEYKYTYTVNLWDLIYRDLTHSHNFTIYTL